MGEGSLCNKSFGGNSHYKASHLGEGGGEVSLAASSETTVGLASLTISETDRGFQAMKSKD